MEEKKMTANDAIASMINTINGDNKKDFYKIAEKYASNFAPGSSIGGVIKRTLNRRPTKLIDLDSLPYDLKKLLNHYITEEDNVYLDVPTDKLIKELLIEWSNIDVYKYHNLPIRNKILLHGPTGNGKTTIAKHIAKVSDLPFVEVSSDMVIESTLGSSGRNINKIFSQLNQPCILFWDEVDSIGRIRGAGKDSSAAIENERMVNSILVNLEKLHPEVIFIGATNRKSVLDSAFLRRFDVDFEISAPNSEQKKTFADQMIKYYKLPNEYVKDTYHLESYSKIKMSIVDNARKYIISTLKK